MGELEERVRVLEKGNRKVDNKEGNEIEERVRRLKRERERRERYKRRNNIIVRDFKEERGDARKRVYEIFKQIGANAKMEKVRIVRTGKEERRGWL